MERLLREPPPEEGRDFAAVLAEFADKVAPFACRVNHPRFLAFVPGAPTFLSVLGDLLCAGTNFFAGVWLEAAGPTEVELVVLDWFREFLDMPAGDDGHSHRRRFRGQPDRPGRGPRTPVRRGAPPGRPLRRRAAALVHRSGREDHGRFGRTSCGPCRPTTTSA